MGSWPAQKLLPHDPLKTDIDKMIEELREKDVSINREQRQVGDPEGLSILEEIAILRDRIKTIEQRNEAIEKKSELILC